MENSIEKDIHLLESYAGMTHKMTDNQGRPKLDQAIEHILSDYKRVLKENEEKSIILLAGAEKVKQLEKENEELQKELKIKNNQTILGNINSIKIEDLEPWLKPYYISKQKIEAKIEELKKKVGELTDEQGYWGGSDLLEQVEVLQELLEEKK